MERRLLTLIALFALAALATLGVETAKGRTSTPSKLSPLPAQAGRWIGKRAPLSQEEIDILGTDAVDRMLYRDDKGRAVSLCVVSERRKRASFHPPEYCYLAQSNVSITEKGRTPVSLSGKRIEASTMTLQMGEGQTLVVYWYKTGTFYTPSYYEHQLSFLWRMFSGGDSESAMVRITAPVGDDGVEGALKSVKDLLSELSPRYTAL